MAGKRVKAIFKGYAPRDIGGIPERIAVGEIITVPVKMTGKWFEEVDGPKPGRKPKEDTAAEA